MTAPNATSLAIDVTIGGSGIFDDGCQPAGSWGFETLDVNGGSTLIRINASEVVIVHF